MYSSLTHSLHSTSLALTMCLALETDLFPLLGKSLCCRRPISSIHGIFPAKTLEWVAMPSSRGSSRPRDRTRISYISCIAGRFFTSEPPGKPSQYHTGKQILELGLMIAIYWTKHTFLSSSTSSLTGAHLSWVRTTAMPSCGYSSRHTQ